MRVALVGCGAFAERFYVPALCELLGASQVTLIDPNDGPRQALAGVYGIPTTAEALNDVLEDVDGAIIATPHHLHCELAKQVIDARIPVLCEKPLSVSYAEGESLVEYARSAGIPLVVNHTRRLFPASELVARYIREGRLGSVERVYYAEGSAFAWPTRSGFYFGNATGGRGVLLDKGPHIFDLLCWWLGSDWNVTSCLTDSYGGPEGWAEVRLRQGQASALVNVDWLCKRNSTFRVEGTAGVLEGIPDELNSVMWSSNGVRRAVRSDVRAVDYWSLGKKVVDNFCALIAGRNAATVSGEESLASMRVIEACYERAKRPELPWYDQLEPSAC